MSTEQQLANVGYNEDNMKTLKDAAHIRQNPGMYVGNTGPEGLHHLVYEIVYNSVDEALAGYCKMITVVIDVDGSVSRYPCFLTNGISGARVAVERRPQAVGA